jgi:LysM domain
MNEPEVSKGKGRAVMRAAGCLVVLLIGAIWIAAVRPPPAFGATPEPVLGTVYVFRPIGGKFTTPEMDNLATKIQARGLEAKVFNYVDWIRPANAAIARYKSEVWKSAIILVGHSAGGDSTIRFATWLKRAGVPVNLIVTIDPTRIAGSVPSNVERFVNIYGSMNTLGGGDPKPAADFTGHFASVDLKNFHELHVELPKVAGLQDAIVDKIMAVVEQPVVPKTPGVQIEYAIPRGEPIVLWDSGMTVAAAAGDTPATIAAQYGVPAWAVTVINHIEPDRHLAAGQRVVVPHTFESDQPPKTSDSAKR